MAFTNGTWKDKALFTPGPLTTSRTVKQVMLRDLGSRDVEFIHTVREVRRLLLEIGQANPETTTAILMQGSGTFGIEAVISSVVPPQGKLLVLVNGAYGERMVKMAHIYQIPVVILASPENLVPDLDELEHTLAEDPSITSFYYPDHPNFSFKTFYEKLSEKGCVIYPGKLSRADCFRIGHIGRLDQSDVVGLLSAVAQTLEEMELDLSPVQVKQ
jgi:aspartate aminotransferase-like enzyme